MTAGIARCSLWCHGCTAPTLFENMRHLVPTIFGKNLIEPHCIVLRFGTHIHKFSTTTLNLGCHKYLGKYILFTSLNSKESSLVNYANSAKKYNIVC